MKNEIMFPLFAEEDSGSGGADEVDAALGQAADDEGDTEESDDDTDDADASDEGDADEQDSDKDEEDDTDEEEGKETEDEQSEDEVSVSSSPVKSATKKYPKLFKEFPEFREAYFRDRDFRQIFPSVEDARLAYDAQEQYQYIQNEVASGNPESIVQFLSRDTGTLTRFGRAFLKNAMHSNQEAFEHITKPILIGVLTNAAREAETHGNKNLAASVRWISQFAFGSRDIPNDDFRDDRAPSNGNDRQLIARQLGDFTGEVFEQGQAYSLDAISESLADLKVNKAVKKTLIREIFKAVDDKIAQDAPHMRMMDSMWNKVRKGAINRQNRATIVSAYVGAFKKLLPSVRAQVLKDNGIVVKKGPKKEAVRMGKENFSKDRPAAGNTTPSARDKRYAGKSDMEILNMFSK